MILQVYDNLYQLVGKLLWVSLSAIHNHMFSVGDTSGDGTGQGNNRILRLWTKIRARRTTCGLALSCLKMAFGRPQRQGKTTRHTMSEMYWFAFKLPSIRIRGVRVVHPKAVQAITSGAGPLSWYRMESVDERSPRSRLTCIRLQNIARRTGIRLKRRHWATSARQSRRFSQCPIVKGRCSNSPCWQSMLS